MALKKRIRIIASCTIATKCISKFVLLLHFRFNSTIALRSAENYDNSNLSWRTQQTMITIRGENKTRLLCEKVYFIVIIIRQLHNNAFEMHFTVIAPFPFSSSMNLLHQLHFEKSPSDRQPMPRWRREYFSFFNHVSRTQWQPKNNISPMKLWSNKLNCHFECPFSSKYVLGK